MPDSPPAESTPTTQTHEMVALQFTIFIGVIAATSTQVAAGSSFASVYHYFLAALNANDRDIVIRSAINGGAKVIRTFLRQEVYTSEKGDVKNAWSDIEHPVGNFINPLSSFMGNYNDMLCSIYTRSAGQMKVILSLHDAKMIAGFTQPYDTYCSYLQEKGMEWSSFYTDWVIRNAYKTRISQVLNNYPSKNFGDKPWSQLSRVILAIDLQNEPGISKPR